ncbi:Protein DEHYDRATION-INDUCED 19 like [Actinidia chinensis var. chinensis]|uniref:Protein DEHYDRATION-INDUCED 19 like n=1 Tax=Actinidia chinensis var. chinensis TaxID=1590841 RepID=A0A2R6PDP9_ACTCC|nr:Protein DEHYDRATION-INDUCED 19 like [Actinidia chinensis var. chinensis]
MDVDMWASRFHSAKHLSVLQAARLNHNTDNRINMNALEGDDDTSAYFPCPYCDVEIELRVLCSHLQEEHCFDLKNAVCPLCAANLGKDALGHFTVQHAHSVKRRKKNQKPGIWSNSSTMFSKDLRELSSFLGSSAMSGRGNVHDSAPDPLLSPFICNVPLSDHKGNQEDECSGNAASTTSDVTSTVPARWDELQEQDYEERKLRAAFLQQLILSTIF